MVTRQFRHYLLGRLFTVRTDHRSLTWLVNIRHPEGQIARWLEELSQYNMKIEHRPGKKHVNADALSREIVDEGKRYSTHVQLADLPCGEYCTRAHEKWQDLAEEVDDVIPLAQLFQEIPTDDPAVGGGLTNVESKVKELRGHGVWDDDADETTLPSVRLLVNKDELEGSNALACMQFCQVKSGRGKNLSDKGISLS